MSHDPSHRAYNKTMVNAWTALSALVALGVFAMFVFNQPLTQAGHWIWDLIRYFAQPII
jgi:hypothetical protein